MSRPTKACLSASNLLHNIEIIKGQAPGSHIIAMVKANAYGHGIRSVANRLEGHVDMLGVASIDEALALRAHGVQTPILLAEGIFSPEELPLAAQHGFHVVVHHTSQLRWLEETPLTGPLPVWIKIDTGMGRLGFLPHEFRGAYERLLANPHVLQPIHVMSHFACADEKDHPLNEQQIKVFEEVTQGLKGPLSFCNSAGIFNFSHLRHQFVRPGIVLYGASPFKDRSADGLGLKPVMSLGSQLIAIKSLSRGSTLGYGARYTCKSDSPIGVVACGYGDGYPLAAPDGTPVLVNGFTCPLVGRISMDMLTVDLAACPDAQVGDPVTLWGEGLSVNVIAKACGPLTSPYALLTGLQNRVPFVWD